MMLSNIIDPISQIFSCFGCMYVYLFFGLYLTNYNRENVKNRNSIFSLYTERQALIPCKYHILKDSFSPETLHNHKETITVHKSQIQKYITSRKHNLSSQFTPMIDHLISYNDTGQSTK